jgi:hypothetical protein
MFFSEEKKQKTFMSCAGLSLSGHGRDIRAGGGIKVFLLLFLQKKKAFTF